MPCPPRLPALTFRTVWLPLLLLSHCHPHAASAGPHAGEPGPAFTEPIQDPEALGPFFRDLDALASGQDRVVRVFQFGDSHTAEGSWTDRMRRHLQARFGDGGPGLVLPGRPLRGFGHAGLTMSEGRAWPCTTLKTAREDLPVGLPGAALTLPPTEAFRVRGAFGSFEVQSLGPPGAGPSVALTCPRAEGASPGPHLQLGRTVTPLAHGQTLACLQAEPFAHEGDVELAVTLPPAATLLGVDLRSGRPGLVYDELGIWGAWFLELKRWSAELRQVLLRSARPSLVVLAYGTNEMGWQAYDLANYEAATTALLRTLRREAPGAAFLVVGPMDRGAATAAEREALARRADRIIDALRRSAAVTGCAFWDARQAMGGKGAWAPLCAGGLAAEDGIHLTRAGYTELGDRLSGALLTAYEGRRPGRGAAAARAASP